MVPRTLITLLLLLLFTTLVPASSALAGIAKRKLIKRIKATADLSLMFTEVRDIICFSLWKGQRYGQKRYMLQEILMGYHR